MKLLIVGGGGMIGQAITRKHLDAGDEVFIYDTRVNPYIDYSSMWGVDVTAGDKDFDFDILSHQAALVGVGQSQYDINRYVDNNIKITSAILQALLNSKKKVKIIFAGSMGPYGEAFGKGAIKETYRQNPQSIYAVTKQTQENLIKVFSETYEIPALSLRYFSVYSTTQNPLNPLTGVLSIIANKLLNSDKVELFGSGDNYRDLVEVSDVAEAHFLASRYNWKNFDVINVGTGVATQLDYIANKMKDLIDPSKEVIFDGTWRKGDIRGMQADISKIQKKLSWNPKISIDAGITAYCEYINKNKDKFIHPDTTKEENDKLRTIGLIK